MHFFVSGEEPPSSRDFFSPERLLRLCSVLRECGRDRRINPAFSTGREISYSSSFSYFSPQGAKHSAQWHRQALVSNHVQFCNPAASSYEGTTSLHGLYL